MDNLDKEVMAAAYFNIETGIETLNIVNSEHFNIKLLDEDHEQDEKWLSDYCNDDEFRDIQDRIKQIIVRKILISTEVYKKACESLGKKANLPYGYPEELK